jgi:hypothetical protein
VLGRNCTISLIGQLFKTLQYAPRKYLLSTLRADAGRNPSNEKPIIANVNGLICTPFLNGITANMTLAVVVHHFPSHLHMP